MAVCKTLCAGIFLASALVHLGAAAQASAAPAAEASSLSRKEGRIMLDYQQVKVAGDEPIDFMGLHVLKPVTDSVWIGAGVYAPLFKGEYGGFTAFDVGVHLRHRLTPRIFARSGRLTGCRYATIASVSTALGDSRVSPCGRVSRRSCSAQRSLARNAQPPATRSSTTPRVPSLQDCIMSSRQS